MTIGRVTPFVTSLNNRISNLHEVIARDCEFIRMSGKPDKIGGRKPFPTHSSKFKLSMDVVVTAIGQMSDEGFIKINPEIKLSESFIVIDAHARMTTQPTVFAVDDIVNGGATVVQAAGEEKKVACGIHHLLSNTEPKGLAKVNERL